jgi:ferric-dicitrate binding protein FerR (iron transport regulator)
MSRWGACPFVFRCVDDSCAIVVESRERYGRARCQLARWSVLWFSLVWGTSPVQHIQQRSVNTRRVTGQRAVVELADGSRMILAPRTSAVFRLEGSEQARVVTVVGQARFEVNPTATSPFIVRTRGVTARVLGTTFDVRQYPDEVSGTVAVLAGKVVAGSTVRRVILTAGMEGRFADSTVAMRIFTDSADYGDWTHGQLAFRDVPVKTLLTTLQHWYGYRFELKDSSLAAQHVTTVFAANDSPAMIRQLKVLLGVRMTFEDSVVTLRPIRGTGAPSQLQKYKTRYSSPHSTEAGR